MATAYSVKITNNSLLNGKICLFQKMPEQPNHIFSLAWYSKQCNKGSNIKFGWNVEYCATWAETGILKPGITFEAGASKAVDPGNVNENSLGFTYVQGGFTFEDTAKKAPAGTIGIYTSNIIPNGQASFGVGMNGESAFATQAYMNLNFIFTPKVKYYLLFGNYEQGVVMDLTTSTDAFELKFPLNVNYREIELGEDNCFRYIK